MFAARSGNQQIVKLLLQSGADPRLKSDGKKIASDYTNDPKIQYFISRAIASVNGEEIRLLWMRQNTLKKQKSRISPDSP